MQTTKKRSYKILKWLFGIFFFIFLILCAFAWYLNVKSRPFLSAQIKTILYKSSDSLYTITFSKVTTNIITGNATLQNVKIKADTARFKQLIALKRAPNNLYEVSLKKLVIKHFHPLKIFRTHELEIDEVLFDKPELLMVNKQFDFNENRPPRPLKSPYDFIKKNLASFSIQTIRFKDVSFKYVNNNKSNVPPFLIDDLNITLTDLLIDSTSASDPKRLYLLKDVVINLNNYTYSTPDKLYHINLEQLDFRASTGKLRVSKFSLEPLYDEMKFGQVVGYSKDRFDIQLRNLLLDGIDLPLYIKKQELRANHMNIANGSVSVFNDRSLPKKKVAENSGKFPHQLLQQVGAPLLVKNIHLNEINISYAVYDKESNQKGKISFQHTSGSIKNATNIDTLKLKNKVMSAHLNTYLMGQGKLAVNFNFDLLAKDGAFSFSGILNSTNARIMNQITKPLGLVQINRGYVDKMAFDFKANNVKSIGTVNFWYYDLYVALMRNDPERGHLVKRGLISFLANALLINSENPGRDGKFISAKVNYTREANASFFNLIWRSLFTGIKYSIGITEEKQSQMRAHIANFKAMQESHRLRKQKRLERRKLKETERGQER